MSHLTVRVLAGFLALALTACGDGDDEPAPAKTPIDLLDPSVAHEGKTYAEWAAAWVQYWTGTAPPECVNPITDATGAGCTLYQDPEAPVFFLVGNFGGVSLRDACVVPAGKSLFLPLISTIGDNAGVPADMLLSDADLENFVEASFDVMLATSLHLSVDGQSIARLERGGIRSAPYSIDLAPEANLYTPCSGVEGVEGKFDGYVSGYWAMLAPLSPGAHTLQFGGNTSDSPQGQPLTIDVRYDLTVE
jgi:hypothetical protein